jgi:hypothetical protein
MLREPVKFQGCACDRLGEVCVLNDCPFTSVFSHEGRGYTDFVHGGLSFWDANPRSYT